MCERGSTGRLGAEVGESGVTDSVIMTFPERSGSGSPMCSAAGEPEALLEALLEASDSTESTGLGSVSPPGRVRVASMVTVAHACVSLSFSDRTRI